MIANVTTQTVVTIGLYLVVINAVTYGAYWLDKYKARRGHWRIKESTLHWLGLLGGTPAAYYAQHRFRHKTFKTSFQNAYWSTVAAQAAMVTYFLLGDKEATLAFLKTITR